MSAVAADGVKSLFRDGKGKLKVTVPFIGHMAHWKKAVSNTALVLKLEGNSLK